MTCHRFPLALPKTTPKGLRSRRLEDDKESGDKSPTLECDDLSSLSLGPAEDDA